MTESKCWARLHDTRIKSPVLCQTELTARSYGEGVPSGYTCNQFLADRESRGLSPRTVRFYHDKLNYVIDHITDKPLLDLTKQDIQQILMDLTCNPGGKHSYLRALRAFFSWAEESDLIPRSPCARIRLKVPKPLRYSVKVENVLLLLAACQSSRDKLIVLLLADTGLRLSELASVKAQDVNLETSTIRVWGKGAKQRVVRYGPQTASFLIQYLEEAAQGEALLGLAPRGISIMLSRLGERTGIKCNAHAFRRTFATESVRNGLNLFHVQSLLGHANLTMTRVYAEQVNSEDAIKAYKPIVT